MLLSVQERLYLLVAVLGVSVAMNMFLLGHMEQISNAARLFWKQQYLTFVKELEEEIDVQFEELETRWLNIITECRNWEALAREKRNYNGRGCQIVINLPEADPELFTPLLS